MHGLAALGPIGRMYQAMVERELARLPVKAEGRR